VSTLELEHGFDAWTLYSEWVPVALSSPAAGAALTYTVPGATQLEVLSASFTYTASASAANRIPFLAFLDQSGTSVGSFGTPYKLVANDASRISFGVFVAQSGADSAARIATGIPSLRLQAGMQVQLSATAISAADQISAARLYVRQWRVRE